MVVPVVALAPLASGQSLFQSPANRFQATATLQGLGFTNAFLPFTQPGPGSTDAVFANITSRVGYSFTEQQGGSQLDITVWQYCTQTSNTPSAQMFSDASFTCPAGTPYSITGLYSVPSGFRPAELHMDFSILASPGGTIFRHSTVRNVSGGSSIVLGVPISGDTFIGSPTGVFSAGVTYTIGATIYVVSRTPQQGEEVATGTFSIALTRPPCYPNCDGSTLPPILNVNDFQCFLNRFAAGESYANCDGSTLPPVLNVNDFQCFLNTYAAGCS
jgi:hypothetical protein